MIRTRRLTPVVLSPLGVLVASNALAVGATINPGGLGSGVAGHAPAWALGGELSFMVFPEEIQVTKQLGYGGFLQAQSYDLSYGRYAGGFQFGNALGGEVGWAYRDRGPTTDWSQGLHLGAFFSAGVPVLSLRTTIPVQSGHSPTRSPPGLELALCLAIKLPIPIGDPDFIGPLPHGRPLRVGDHALLPELRVGGEAIAPESLSNSDARRWAEDAQAEAASVPAFLRLAWELELHGARGLAKRARRAAHDEVRHTRACLALASEHAHIALGLGPIPLLPPRTMPLEALAAESYVDGYIGEGRSAADARARLAVTRNPLEQQALAMIARDEQQHANLGRDIVDFALTASACLRNDPATHPALAGAPPDR